MANKAEITPEEQSKKAESYRENLWNKIQLKGPYRQKQTQEQNKKEWASSVGLCETQTVTTPPREGEPAGAVERSGGSIVHNSAGYPENEHSAFNL